MQRIDKYVRKLVSYIGIFVFILLLLCIITTTNFRGIHGFIEYQSSSFVFNLASTAFVVCSVSALLYHMRFVSEKTAHIIAILVSACSAIACLILQSNYNFAPKFDAADIYQNASALFLKQPALFDIEYYKMYPFQSAITCLVYFYMKLVGSSDYHLLQALYAFFTGGITYLSFRITRQMFHSWVTELMTLVMTASFLPSYFYSVFIYGETPGIFFAELGILLFLLLNDSKKKSCLQEFMLSIGIVLCITTACLLKGNLVIILIALAFIQFIASIKYKKPARLLIILVAMVLILVGNHACVSVLENKAGADFGKGCPKILWVAMGLQDDESNLYGPGAYNEFHTRTFIESDYDAQKSTQIAIEDIKNTLSQWTKNPLQAAVFLKKKISVQWCDPTYEAYYNTISPVSNENLDPFNDSNKLYIVKQWLKTHQIFLYIAILLYFVWLTQEKDSRYYLAALLLLGEFVLSLLWETRSRYVYPYLIISIPFVTQACVLELGKIFKLVNAKYVIYTKSID